MIQFGESLTNGFRHRNSFFLVTDATCHDIPERLICRIFMFRAFQLGEIFDESLNR